MKIKRSILLILLLLPVVALAQGPSPYTMTSVAFYDDGRSHPVAGSGTDQAWIDKAFPFCPTDSAPCNEQKLVWFQARISMDVYTLRRQDPHSSIEQVLDLTRKDIAPLVEALQQHFSRKRIVSDAQKVSFVQGLVQAVTYKEDASTGWTEYPKFGIEFLVDELGDCDDAAILNTLILEGLGYSAYFVHWTGTPGHLSTAIEPNRGDLSSVVLPEGSSLVEAPGLPGLLHVDATGAPQGCGKANVTCGKLGYNQSEANGLKLDFAMPSIASDADSRLRLSAWTNGGRNRPSQLPPDRRTLSEERVRDEIFDQKERERRLQDRLRFKLGIEEGQVRVYLKPAMKPWVYQIFLVSLLGILVGLVVFLWRRRRQRRRRVEELRARRRDGAF